MTEVSNIVSFLYILLRDHIPFGVIDSIVKDATSKPKEQIISNDIIGQYAHALAKILTNSNANDDSVIVEEAEPLMGIVDVGTDILDIMNNFDVMYGSDAQLSKAMQSIDFWVQHGNLSEEDADSIRSELDELCEEIKVGGNSNDGYGG